MRRILTLILVLALAVITFAGCDLINQFIPGGGCAKHVDENGDLVCDKCEAKLDESHEHSWLNATCTSPRTCSICGATEGEALGHAEEDLEGKDATCTATGLTNGKRCSDCGEILEAQEEIPMKDHTYDENGKCSCGAEAPFEDEPITESKITLSGAKTSFAFGESFSYDNIVVKLTQSDSSERTLASDEYTVACEDYNPFIYFRF